MTEDVKTRLMNLRVLPAEQEWWKAEAEKAGLSLSAWVRMVCNAQVAARPAIKMPPQVEQLVASGIVSQGAASISVAGPAFRRKRSGLCPHRVPAGSFCKRCEEG